MFNPIWYTATMISACLDLEGVLIPEVWQTVAETLGIEALNLTTRDIPDYHQLMKHRLDVLDSEGVTLSDIRKSISTMEPLPGASVFLEKLRKEVVVVLLSDTYIEFMPTILDQLDYPTLLCNSLETSDDRITDYHLRLENGKYYAVKAFQQLNLEVRAAGDSYNDLSMIQNADQGALFRPPDQIVTDHPELPRYYEYDGLFDFLTRT